MSNRTITGDEPITLAELRDFMRIDAMDDDGQLARCITAGVDLVERETERDLITGDIVELVEPTNIAGGKCVTLRRSPVVAVTSVTIDGVEVADFVPRLNCHRRSRLIFAQPVSGEIVVNYTTGMPDDATARQACLWAAAHLYCERQPEIVGATVSQFEIGLKRIMKLLGAGGYA